MPAACPEANAVLIEMADTLRAALGRNFVGFYVYGSLANGDFDPDTSDIDAVVVTAEHIEDIAFEKLKTLHGDLFARGNKLMREVELSYIPQSDMHRYDRNHPPRIRLHEGVLVKNFWQGPDWVLHRHVLREQGIIVAGPHPAAMIDPVSPQEIHDAVATGILKDWWQDKVLQKPKRLQDDRYQAHAVLSMCRALCTLHTGGLASKKASAAWARGRLEPRFQKLLDRALAWKEGAKMQDYDLTLDFIRHTLAETRRPAAAAHQAARPSI